MPEITGDGHYAPSILTIFRCTLIKYVHAGMNHTLAQQILDFEAGTDVEILVFQESDNNK